MRNFSDTNDMLQVATIVSAAWHRGPIPHHSAPAVTRSSVVGVATVEEDLLSMLDRVPNRGFFANKLQAATVLELVNGMEDPSESLGGWMNAAEELLLRNWRLRYTSSLAFANNGGLTGFTRVQGVTTPELLMQVSRTHLNFFEPFAPESASLVARHLGLPSEEPLPECAVAQGFWACCTHDQLKVTLQRVVVGSYEYVPANTGGESAWTPAVRGVIGHGGATGTSRIRSRHRYPSCCPLLRHRQRRVCSVSQRCPVQWARR